MKKNAVTLENLTEKALENKPLSAEELRYLLNIEDEDKIELLKHGARHIRSHFFGDIVFLYGFLYFSTHCRNYCSFCNFSANHSMDRYRKTRDEILKISEGLAASGVHLLDLTMGEDLFYLKNNGKKLEETVNDVLQLTNLPIMVSPGVVESGLLRKFARLGVSWYACYQETYSPSLFKKLRAGQSFKRRLLVKQMAKRMRLLVEDGMLLHVGESVEDILLSIQSMHILGAQQVRVMTYVPPKIYGICRQKKHHLNEEMLIAILRYAFPDKLIPASLDVEGIAGLTSRLMAGANVISSIVPPKSGLNGVSQTTLDIEDGKRTVENVKTVLKELGLQAAKQDFYKAWLYNTRTVDMHGQAYSRSPALGGGRHGGNNFRNKKRSSANVEG